MSAKRCNSCAQELDAEQSALSVTERLRDFLEELQTRKGALYRSRLVEGESSPAGREFTARLEEAERLELELLTSFPELRAKRT